MDREKSGVLWAKTDHLNQLVRLKICKSLATHPHPTSTQLAWPQRGLDQRAWMWCCSSYFRKKGIDEEQQSVSCFSESVFLLMVQWTWLWVLTALSCGQLERGCSQLKDSVENKFKLASTCDVQHWDEEAVGFGTSSEWTDCYSHWCKMKYCYYSLSRCFQVSSYWRGGIMVPSSISSISPRHITYYVFTDPYSTCGLLALNFDAEVLFDPLFAFYSASLCLYVGKTYIGSFLPNRNLWGLLQILHHRHSHINCIYSRYIKTFPWFAGSYSG